MWRSFVLPRRPGKMTAREEVEVKMEHGLAGAAAVIDDHPVAFGVEAFFLGDFFAARKRCPMRSLSDSIMLWISGMCFLGTTRVWTGAWGLTSSKAVTSPSS